METSREPARFRVRRESIFLGTRQTSLWNRVLAKSIDATLLLTVYLIGNALVFPLGVVLALMVCSVWDGMGIGQSFGKRVIGLQVLEEPLGLTCSYGGSTLRNLPFLIAILSFSFPFLWIAGFLIAVPWIGLELYLLMQLDGGVRLGDVLGNTRVKEYVEGTSSDGLSTPG